MVAVTTMYINFIFREEMDLNYYVLQLAAAQQAQQAQQRVSNGLTFNVPGLTPPLPNFASLFPNVPPVAPVLPSLGLPALPFPQAAPAQQAGPSATITIPVTAAQTLLLGQTPEHKVKNSSIDADRDSSEGDVASMFSSLNKKPSTSSRTGLCQFVGFDYPVSTVPQFESCNESKKGKDEKLIPVESVMSEGDDSADEV